ncbi:response regulator transcription factor [Hyphobacterium sp. HN65]|uniref:Response regulator transcription factor n=1 Tax=Hyphobacterium lacteum TaxID=3116575 RepID=A0ABU7LR84_9PROT|nr:response regulator transcription factor [Hyphobacterium sp. HN65]MEE2526430.1 response regulator transcription factor [Hyphobacterium sp. HN65]
MTELTDTHILVVDDDDRIRELIKRFLAQRGFRITTAADASRAQAKMRSMDFDLIVLDVMMPGMDGFELTGKVRENRETPILLLTARGEAEDRIRGLSLGADDYLSKPFEPEELVLRINNILRRARPAGTEHKKVRFGRFQFDISNGSLIENGAPVRLTGGEETLLKALAREVGQTVSRYDLCELTGGGERAVDVQMTRLRRKLEADPRQPVHLQTIRGEGYKLIADAIFEDQG